MNLDAILFRALIFWVLFMLFCVSVIMLCLAFETVWKVFHGNL